MRKHAVTKRMSAGISAASITSLLLGSVFALPATASPTKVSASDTDAVVTEQAPETTDRFVVKFSGTTQRSAVERVKTYDKITDESGIAVDEVKTTASGAQIITTGKELSEADADKLLQELNDEPNVISAEPDVIVYPASLTPADELYPEQWHLNEDPGGLRVSNAWGKTTGTGQVVAVIDTGITKHSDLDANVLPGYDMISDATKSRDGDGRDANPLDEGDWRSSTGTCNTGNGSSSWHGTHVAGIIAAVANTKGVIGAAPGAKILPVRAMGACGGYMSDISDSIVWASGGTVSGVPANPNPAKVINLSLSGSGQCLSYVQSAIDTAVGRGSAVFVAAGNQNTSTAGISPANCNNVITVAASSRNGYRSSYSNYGTQVDVTAPGGDAYAARWQSIMSTFNAGDTVPGAESYKAVQGTSTATPQAASVGAMLYASDPTMTPAKLEANLKQTARPLPGGCDKTSGCGAGIVDAAAALGAPLIETIGVVPVIKGTGKIDTTLSVDTGVWTPSDVNLTYQWKRDGWAVSGETNPTYAVTSFDTYMQSLITVEVTGRKQGATSVTKTSAGVQAVNGDFVAPKPVIVGEPNVGNYVYAQQNTWTPEPNLTDYTWKLDGTAVSTGGGYTLAPEDVGKQLTVTLTGKKSGYNEKTVTSDPVTVSAPSLVTGTATVSGEAKVGSALAASSTGWSPEPVTLSYQWKRSGLDILGATSQTYVLTDADAGKVMSVAVTGTKDQYPSATVVSEATAPVALGTITTTAVSITGVAEVAGGLSAVLGNWGPAPVTLAYQWKRNGVDIAGATSKMYVPIPEDAGQQLSVVVTGTKIGYTTANVTSPATTIKPGYVSPGTVTISGLASVGNTLTANEGRWLPSPITLSYQWKRNGVDIPGATARTYKLAPVDAGKKLTVAVTGVRANYNPTTVLSPSTVTIELGVLDGHDPIISGTAKVGESLTASSGIWGPAPVALTYQWKRAGVNITGATSSTYVLTGADAGKTITVDAIGNKEGYQTGTLGSAATAPVAMGTLTTGPATITGSTKVGSTLSAASGSWGPAPVTLTYQWKRAGVNIAGATKATYALVGADAGKQISVTVTGTKAGYTTASTTSPLTAAVAIGTLTTALTTITGTSKVGYALTAKPGIWTAGTALSYQWYRSGVAITGAKSATYTLVAADLGKRMTVRVTGTQLGYTSAYRVSGATVTVVIGTLVKSTPKITGTLRAGYVLTANPGTWTSGTTLYYQWYRSGVAIKGGSAKTYRLTTADRGKTMTVRVTGVKAGYTSAAVMSAATARIP